MLLMNHGNLVMGEPREGPRTLPELAAARDLTESLVRDAVGIAAEEGMVYRLDGPEHTDEMGRYTGRYAFDESKPGGGRSSAATRRVSHAASPPVPLAHSKNALYASRVSSTSSTVWA